MTPGATHARTRSTLLESGSPDPSLFKVICLDPKTDYRKQAWKNGLGTTTEIAIYPTDKDFKKETFFWRLSIVETRSNSTFSIFPGYDCTMVVLPKEKRVQPSLLLRHQDTETLTNSFGTAKCNVVTLGSSVSDTQEDKILLVNAFTLIYVVKGNCCIKLDENRNDGHRKIVNQGQCLYIQRDQDAGPSHLEIKTDSERGLTTGSEEVTFVIVQITENSSASKPSVTDPNVHEIESIRRTARRRSSLVVYPKQFDKISEPKPENIKLQESKIESGIGNEETPEVWDPTQIYEPPSSFLLHNDIGMPPPVICDKLVIEDYALHATSTAWIKIMTQGMNEWIKLPVIICRGSADGQTVTSSIDVQLLRGTLVAIPCVNVMGYLKFQREFADGRDLNRLFPGKEDGYASQVYCFHLMNKIISQFNYHIDLHTASFGRINSFYVRADMNDPGSALLAQLQKPQIILHNSGQDGTLRSAAAARGITSITVEIGNPQLFQEQYIEWSYMGVMRVLNQLNMFPLESIPFKENFPSPSLTILCSKGFWIYTKTGGVLEVYPDVNSIVRKGDIIARLKSMFGNVIAEYTAPCTGIVIGRSSNPVAMAGDRIIHLGIIKHKGESLLKEAKENY
ncbi:hypothetical protein BDF14DRAFT_1722450 [Spinellus fusiger]|nr:hypothetical protein BDF14DRAFT_1722450 [Spinellus fusiger]